jgi:hypothetical protein
MDYVTQLISANRFLAATAIVLLMLVFVPPARTASLLLLRIAARVMMLAALIALVSDGTRTIATDGGIVVTSFLQYWAELAPAGLETAKKTLSIRIHPMFWDGLLAPLLSLPAWLVLGVTAAIIAVLARKRRRTNIYANA